MVTRKIDLQSLAKGTLQAGRVVLVDGLQNQPELNGQCGNIIEYHEEKGRYSVQLSGKTILLRPESLRLPLPSGHQVLLSELPKEWQHFNGTFVHIGEFLPEQCRYRVQMPKRFCSSNVPDSILVEPFNVIDDNTKCKSFAREVQKDFTDDDRIAMIEEQMQRTEPVGYDNLRKLIHMEEQPREKFSGIDKGSLLRCWLEKTRVDAALLGYKDVPIGLLREMDAGLEHHVQIMSEFTPQAARQATACIEGELHALFERACDFNDKGRTDKSVWPAKAFIDAYEAAPFISSLVEFEVRHLPHPDDNVCGCSHMASTMYNLSGHDPESSLAVRYKRMLYAFHLRMHMYCRAVGSERHVWLRRLSETAGSLSSILQEQNRIDDAVFCFKVSAGMTWASGKSDAAAKKMMLAGKKVAKDSKDTFAMRDGKVIRGFSATSLKYDFKTCSNCGDVEPLPDEFKRCPCRMVAYCGPVCQKSHWKEHKKTCAAKKTGKT